MFHGQTWLLHPLITTETLSKTDGLVKEKQPFFLEHDVKSSLTHCGLVMQYGYNDLGQFGLLLHHTKPLPESALTYHQRRCGIHLGAILWEKLMNLICNECLEITCFRLLPLLPGDNGLNLPVLQWLPYHKSAQFQEWKQHLFTNDYRNFIML